MTNMEFPVSGNQLVQVNELTKAYIDRADLTERTRAANAEAALDTKIEDEKERAITEEGKLQVAVNNEETRATAAEGSLEEKIQQEILRAQNAENLISNGLSSDTEKLQKAIEDAVAAVDVEKQRAMDAENTINQTVQATKEELVTKMAEDLSPVRSDATNALEKANENINRISDLVSTVNANKAAAEAEAVRLTQSITTEVSRATESEAAVAAGLSSVVATVTTLTDTVNDNKRAFDIEVIRSTEKDTELEGKITEEVTRATGAEGEIRTSVATLKEAVDTFETNVDDKIAVETTRATAAEAELKQALDAERDRADHAEEVLGTKLNEFIDATGTNFTNLTNDLHVEVGRAKETEAGLDTKITEEVTRARTAEDALTTAITAEAARATAAEAELKQALDAERDRAEASEEFIIGDYNAKIDEEKEARAKRDSELTNAHRSLKEFAETNVNEIKGRLDTAEDTLASHGNSITDLQRTAGVTIKQDATSVVLVNAADEVLGRVNTVSTDDPTVPGTALGTKKFIVDSISVVDQKLDATNEKVADVDAAVKAVDAKVEEEKERSMRNDLIHDDRIHDLQTFQQEQVTKNGELDTAIEGLQNIKLDKTFFSDLQHPVIKAEMSVEDGMVKFFSATKLPSNDEVVEQTVALKSIDGSIHFDPVEGGVDLSAHQDMTEILEKIDTKVDKTVLENLSLLKDFTLTRVKNIPARTDDGYPEYGYTWTFDKISHTFDGAEDVLDRVDLNMFYQSGASEVQHELYDEIARSKIKDDELTAALAEEVATRTSEVADLNTKVNEINGRAFTNVELENDQLKFSVVAGDVVHTVPVAVDPDSEATGQSLTSRVFVDAKDTALDAKFSEITDNLSSEFDNLAESLANEVIRSTTAEQAINESLTNEVSRASSAEAALQDAVDALNPQITAMTTKIDAMKNGMDTNVLPRLSTVESDITTLQTTVAEQAEKITALETQVNNQSALLTAAKGYIDTLNTQVETLNTQVADLTAKLDALTAKVESITPPVTE